jgi:hypothetical protein
MLVKMTNSKRRWISNIWIFKKKHELGINWLFKKMIAVAVIYHAAPVVILHQFLWVSRKFEIAVSFVKILVRSLSWDFFPLYFFYSFYQFSIRRWDVDLHEKFQPHNIFL